MEKFSSKKFLQLSIYYRGWLSALLVGLLVFFLLTGSHKGSEVLIAVRDLAPGTNLTSADFSRGWIESSDPSIFQTELTPTTKSVSFIPTGAPLLRSQLGDGIAADRVIVNLPLETGDNTIYPAGASAHIWGLADGMLELISAEALVLGTAESRMGAARISLSLPKYAESQAMQAQAVRVVLIGSFG